MFCRGMTPCCCRDTILQSPGNLLVRLPAKAMVPAIQRVSPIVTGPMATVSVAALQTRTSVKNFVYGTSLSAGKTRCGATSPSFRLPSGHSPASVHLRVPRSACILPSTCRRNPHLSRLLVVSSSVGENVKSSSNQGTPANSDPPQSDSPLPMPANPFASGKISSRIAAKQAGDAKQPGVASPVERPRSSKPPSAAVKSQEPPVGQLSASAASQLKVVRPSTVFTVPTKPRGGSPANPADPFTKSPLLPTDWEKAGARPAGSGKRVLDAFREDKQDGTTKFGQPLVPKNIFDDVRRTPEEIAADAFKFQINAGQLLLVGSFVLIIMVMLGTAFLVWKVGAIHYNEY